LSSDFVYELPTEITNVTSMTLNVTEIPNTNFYFSEENNDNYFEITVKRLDKTNPDNIVIIETVFKKILIPDGTWGVSDLLVNINNMFDTNRSLLSYIQFNISASTGKTTIRFKSLVELTIWNDSYGKTRFDKYSNPNGIDYKPNAPFDIQNDEYENIVFDVDFNPANLEFQKSVAWKFGFREKASYTNISIDQTFVEWDIIYYGSLVTNSFYGESIDDYIFVMVDEYTNNYSDAIICSLKNTYMSSRILARVQFRSGPLSINYDNSGAFKTRKYTTPTKISKLHIKIINKYGDIVCLGKTTDYSMVFTFKQQLGR
jgi:hypothetical protein